MSTRVQSAYVSESSIASRYLTNESTIPTGKFHPIDLPTIDFAQIGDTIGNKITSGNYGTIYEVRGTDSPRVYKIIPLNDVKSGDEIRVSKIAADLGIAPTYYSAFVISQGSKNYLAIEMDNAGKSLGKWMEEIGEASKTTEATSEVTSEETSLSEEEKRHLEMMEKIRKMMQSESRFVVTEIPQKKQASMEEAVAKLYPSQEAFYFALFSKIKTLAENNIAYGDTHVGNIMPNQGTSKDMQLIDFDAAKLTTDSVIARIEAINSVYNQVLIKKFRELPNLSPESVTLIQWFANS